MQSRVGSMPDLPDSFSPRPQSLRPCRAGSALGRDADDLAFSDAAILLRLR